MIGRLPKTLEVAGVEQNIRTDYRDILVVMEACNAPELSDQEKALVMLTVLYIDFDQMPSEQWEEAVNKAKWFIDCGQDSEDKKPSKKVIDWDQDESILFPAINKVAGKEVRDVEHLHWWTFIGYFMEIEEGTFSLVLGIRQKKSKGKKLEKWEQEFYQNNKSMCEIKTRYTQEEQEEIDFYNQLLG